MGYFSEINIFTNITLLKYRQGILQIQIRTAERESLRFYCVKDQESEKIGTLRFARLVFRLTHSLFVVEGVLNFFFFLKRTGASILKQLRLLKTLCSSMI